MHQKQWAMSWSYESKAGGPILKKFQQNFCFIFTLVHIFSMARSQLTDFVKFLSWKCKHIFNQNYVVPKAPVFEGYFWWSQKICSQFEVKRKKRPFLNKY